MRGRIPMADMTEVSTIPIRSFITDFVRDTEGNPMVFFVFNDHQNHYSMSVEVAEELVVGLNKAIEASRA